MFIGLIFLIITLIIGSLLAWMIENNGMVVINWLGYEVTTDVLTSLLIMTFFLTMTFALTYLLARILAFNLPSWLKLFSIKRQNKKNQNLIEDYQQAISILPQLLVAIEANDIDNADSYRQKFSRLINDSDLDKFFLKKIASTKKNFLTAEKSDKLVINTTLAKSAYRNRQFFKAIKYSNSALKIDAHYLPALEIKAKSYIRKGIYFKARSIIKNCWPYCQNVNMAQIYDFTNRKFSADQRIAKIKQMTKNRDDYLSNLAIGLIAFKVSDLAIAKQHLEASLKQQKTDRAKRLLLWIAA